MAWASKKQYAICMESEEGKDLIEKLPKLSQDEFQVEFGKLLGKSGVSYNRDEDDDYKEDKDDDLPWWDKPDEDEVKEAYGKDNEYGLKDYHLDEIEKSLAPNAEMSFVKALDIVGKETQDLVEDGYDLEDAYAIARDNFADRYALENNAEEDGTRSPELKKEMTEDKKDEQEAIDEYDETLEHTEDENTKKQLKKIQDEEKAHKEYLEEAKDNPDAVYNDPDEENKDNNERSVKKFLGENGKVTDETRNDYENHLDKYYKEAVNIIKEAGYKDENLSYAHALKVEYAKGEISKEELLEGFKKHQKDK